MLKIALVRWKAKCSRHPRFNPDTDGPDAIRGNCPRCVQLQNIHESHRRTLTLIRTWGPPASLRTEKRNASSGAERQQGLFGDSPREQRDESA